MWNYSSLGCDCLYSFCPRDLRLIELAATLTHMNSDKRDVLLWCRPHRACPSWNGRLALALCILALSVRAAPAPGIIGFQGKLAIPGITALGAGEFKFALVNQSGDGTYWSHDQTSVAGAEPTGTGILLPIQDGNFSVNLGDSTVANMSAPIPSWVFTNSGVYVRVWVKDAAGLFQQLEPDSRLISAPYALAAQTVLAPVAEAQLPASVARLNAKQTFTGINTFTAPTRLSSPYNLLVGRHMGDGSGLTNIRASSIVGMSLLGPTDSGTGGGNSGGNSRQTPVFLENDQTFTGSNIFTGVVQLNNPTNKVVGSHIGDGSGLVNINASSIVGEIGEIALPSGVVIASPQQNDERLLSNGYKHLAVMNPPGWEQGSTVNAPSARFAHTSVWADDRMIIWGGRVGAGGTAVNSGGMYYPDSDSWSSVSTVNAPSPRSAHTAIWTGIEMIIWGGTGPAANLNSGGRFNPASQQWNPTSARTGSGVPSARQGHIAVWTGERMLIWGGHNQTGLLQDGAVYDPDTDTWIALTLPGSPEARTGAGALWATDRVLVWGGEGATGHLRSGSQLLFSGPNPVQWVPISLLGAPTPRRGYSVVWTGQKILVWGGESGGLQLKDGAAYNPVSNTWEPIPERPAPNARSGHAAVWTGNAMLIVGGASGQIELASGWAFDLLEGLWWRLSTAGTPTPRREATACWTGTEALVFGGRAEAQPLADLERLTPQPVWHFYRKL